MKRRLLDEEELNRLLCDVADATQVVDDLNEQLAEARISLQDAWDAYGDATEREVTP